MLTGVSCVICFRAPLLFLWQSRTRADERGNKGFDTLPGHELMS